MTTQTPAGWYPDPYGSPQLRWWDGNQWTDATHPMEAAAGQAPGPQPDRSFPPQGTGPHPSSAPPQAQGTGPHPSSVPPQAGMPPRAEQPRWDGAPGDTARLPVSEYAPPGGGFTGPNTPQQGGPHLGGPQGPHHGPAGPYPGPGGPYPGPGGPYPGPGGPYPGPGGPYPGPGGPQPGNKSPLPWILGGVGAVILVVAIVVAAVFLINPDRTSTASRSVPTSAPTTQQPTPEPTPTPTPTPTAAPPSAGPLPQPSDGRIEDPVTGLSYAYPGDDWIVPTDTGTNPLGIVWTTGILKMSHENYDGRGSNWLGNVFTAELPEQAGYTGPESAKVAAEALLNAIEPTFYQPQHTKKTLESKAIKVSGKDAWQLSVELDFSKISKVSGWKWKKEEVTFVIVDRGAGKRPAVMYISVPDNLDRAVTDRVLTSLELS
ncbi:DUF2510 domain-containing protein [Planobispora rosea]|uniref:DUF2510 domain-containing protein n=1 Tax=Planobispora rosea TaxID=35762 RepID=UPI00083AD134|nr:DUF2510 domain-containing protein [Planobispora rosea]